MECSNETDVRRERMECCCRVPPSAFKCGSLVVAGTPEKLEKVAKVLFLKEWNDGMLAFVEKMWYDGDFRASPNFDLMLCNL